MRSPLRASLAAAALFGTLATAALAASDRLDKRFGSRGLVLTGFGATFDGDYADDAVLLLEHPAKGSLALPPEFRVLNSYRYGDTKVALFVRGGEDR